ncbi:matrin-3-like isoform X2 [Parambassis ranga]|uniref:Matrin-3-like isoform X2 n=1 Tax=Parambassis ranga TaxID=210632 RepID=A0A6P7J3B7_9TELE|nr:matrin-3-like isoform X2 [Parambassis ranga]
MEKFKTSWESPPPCSPMCALFVTLTFIPSWSGTSTSVAFDMLKTDGCSSTCESLYPEWDPGMVSGRGGGLMETPNLSAGLLGPSPMSSGQTGGLSSSWGAGGPGRLSGNQAGQNKSRSRVVVVKYDRKPLSNKTLFAFTEPFGRLREHLVLKQKAFLEMSSHEEALDVVNYYEHHPASLYGKPITFYLSKRLMIIEKDARPSDRMDRPTREVKGHGSKVVFFSNLPREDEKKRELLTIAGRFGIVEKHLFLTDQAFVQLGTVEDAEMLVKYYSMNPLIIKGRQIRLNICAKYKTLNVNRRQGGSGGDGDSRRGGRANSTSSGSGTRTTTSTSKISSSKSSTSSRTREEEEMEEKVQAESPAAEEEVSGVTQEGEDVGEEAADGEGEEPETAEPVWEELKPEEELPVTVDATGDGGRTEAPQGAKSEEQGETEAEASTDEPENKEESITAESTEAAEGELPEQVFDQDFLENMEDFVTLDELEEDEDEARGEEDAIDNTRRGGMRVINIVGFRRGHNFLSELLGLAKPFGKVVKHLVLDLRPEAFLQFETEEEARAMAKFYNSNVTASVCGRPVRVSHSMSYPTIQCGSSRVVYIGQIPNTKYSDKDILKLAEPYGKVRKYFLNRIKRECFLEMDRAEEAEKMAEEYKAKLPRFNGKRLTVYVSRKYKQLKHGHLCVSTSKRASSSPPPKPSQPAHEPPAKKPREEPLLETAEGEEKEEDKQEREEDVQTGGKDETKETAAEEVPEVSEQNSDEDTSRLIGDVPQSDLQEDKLQEEPVGEMETSSNQNGEAAATPPAENKLSTASLPLPPFNPETPIGVEHVKMGYYCRVCFLFYSNEDTAKKTHCSSQTHYDKLQKYLEKEQSKAEKKKVKKTTA